MKKFNFFTGTFERFFLNIPELLLREVPFSDTCLKFMATFIKIVTIFLGRNKKGNEFLDVKNKETNKVMCHRC